MSQTTQMEGPECSTCDGSGEVDGAPFCASSFASSCGCGGRVCGFLTVRCPDCNGTGVAVSDPTFGRRGN